MTQFCRNRMQIYINIMKNEKSNLRYQKTLDGVVGHMKIGPPDQETGEYFIRLTREADTFIYGRKTYQLMVPYWPDVAKNPSGQTTARIEFAQAFDAVDKI